MQPTLLEVPRTPRTPKPWCASEYKVVSLREVMLDKPLADTPEQAARYWREHIVNDPRHNPDVETLVVVLLNTRRRIMGHAPVANGTLDTILVHPREVFRPACIAAAAAIVLMHNHPSGDPSPSEADMKVTRDLIRAGQMMKIELLDHVVMGDACDGRIRDWVSLRELGHFY